MMMNKWN